MCACALLVRVRWFPCGRWSALLLGKCARPLGSAGVHGGRVAATSVPWPAWGPGPGLRCVGAALCCVPYAPAVVPVRAGFLRLGAGVPCFSFLVFLMVISPFFGSGGVPLGFGCWCGGPWRSACSHCRLRASVVLCLSPSFSFVTTQKKVTLCNVLMPVAVMAWMLLDKMLMPLSTSCHTILCADAFPACPVGSSSSALQSD